MFPVLLYPKDPVKDLCHEGAEIIINISASPFTIGKKAIREKIALDISEKFGASVFMVNQVGGNDEIIFDGSSFAVSKGEVIGRALEFEEDLLVIDLENKRRAKESSIISEDERIYKALILGAKDYTKKCGFSKAVIGLSGGIDSALVACIAKEALGSENVIGVGMPSDFNSPGSLTDAARLAENLKIKFEVIPIKNVYKVYLNEMEPLFRNMPFGLAEENLQARIRGAMLMAISNKFGAMVLSTGNKSEFAVGYSTLYGDMCGGLAVISDLFKTRVYSLSRWINRQTEYIPENSISKPPSAELRPGQTDQDDLPPYEILDKVLEYYIEGFLSVDEIIKLGYERSLVERIAGMVNRNEYKRRQAPIGLKVTSKAFGSGRRFPIAQKFFQ